MDRLGLDFIAIIPARGGSKGVPRKNLQKVGGRTLLERAINSARVHDIVEIFVSTDDDEIRAIAIAAGARVIARPAELASDEAPTISALQHALKQIKSGLDRVVLLEPTSPFRTQEHVRQAIRRFRMNDVNSVVSVTQLERKPENIFVTENKLRRYIEAPNETFPRRQDMEKLCRLNSAIYIVGRNDILAGRMMPEPIGWVAMDPLASINIDTPLDLKFAQFVAEEQKPIFPDLPRRLQDELQGW